MCIACVIGCGGDHVIESKVAIELAEQPIIKDGIRSIYEIDLGALAATARPAALERAVRTMRIRLQLAHARGHVAVDGERIVVDLAPVDEDAMQHVIELLERTGRLEFHAVVAGTPIMAALAEHAKTDPAAIAAEITTWRDHWTTDDGAHPENSEWALLATDREQAVSRVDASTRHCWKQGPGDTMLCRTSGQSVIEAYLATLATQDPALAIPRDRMLAFELGRAHDNHPAQWRTHLVDPTPAVTGDSIVRASLDPPDPDDPEMQRIRIELDRAGSEAFAAFTEHHVNDRIATMLDGRVVSTPVIQAAVRGGSVTLRVAETADDARQLAIVLTSGALPGPVTLDRLGKLVGGVMQRDPNAPPEADVKPTPFIHEEHCGSVKATWRGEHDPTDNYDAYKSLELEVVGRAKPWTQDLLDVAVDARTPSLFSPDCQHVLLLTHRNGPYHIIKTDRMAAYLDGAKPDYILAGEKDPKGITGTGVFRGGGWLSNTEVAYTWGCCDPPITTKFVIPP
ncbi:MAG TPA: hypothetical protein VGF94_04285 [Kofleriaceae bacterium]